MQEDSYYMFWRKYWIAAIFTAAALIALLGAWLWCNRIQTNPTRVFWSTINQSLSTASVTMQAAQVQGTDSMKQTVALNLGAQNLAHSIVAVKQGGNEIITEVIATPANDFTRYKRVKTDQPGANEKALQEAGITNVWARSNPQLFNQTLLGLGLSLGSIPVPIANLESTQRAELLKQMRERSVYQVADTVKKEHKNGRLYYTYDVTEEPFVYVQIMKLYAKNVGIKALEQIDPAEYRQLDKIKLTLTVDVRAKRLVKAAYQSSAGGPTYTQTYSSHGVPAGVEPPKKYIPVEELQQRFDTLQQPVQ